MVSYSFATLKVEEEEEEEEEEEDHQKQPQNLLLATTMKTQCPWWAGAVLFRSSRDSPRGLHAVHGWKRGNYKTKKKGVVVISIVIIFF
jgi:hypothetical protein